MLFFQTRPKSRQTAPAAEIELRSPRRKAEGQRRSSAFETGGATEMRRPPSPRFSRVRLWARRFAGGFGQWICLGAISLAFFSWRAAISVPSALSGGNGTSPEHMGPGAYRLWYEAHQMYGRDPDRLAAAQLENVKRWCRCAEIMEKGATHGLDSLSDHECRLVVESLPKRYRNLDEFPAYIDMLHACRLRLDDKDD